MDTNILQATIESLTPKGLDTMIIIGGIAYGKRELGFFDNGVTEGSGSWGECLTGELGHNSSGVINRLAKLGLFETSWDENGTWFELTELGAAVALKVAAPAEPAPITEDPAESQTEAMHAEALDLNADLDLILSVAGERLQGEGFTNAAIVGRLIRVTANLAEERAKAKRQAVEFGLPGH